MTYGKHCRLAVKKGQNCILSINMSNKEERYWLIVRSELECSIQTHESVCILYQVKPEKMFFMSRSYMNTSFFGSRRYCGVKIDAHTQLCFSIVNGAPLHTAFHYQHPIVLIWLKYCWKRRKIASNPSTHTCVFSMHYLDSSLWIHMRNCTARQCSPLRREFMECYIIKPAQSLKSSWFLGFSLVTTR